MRTILTPASRLNDPETSYAAERHINQGSRQSNLEKVAALVKRYPGSTSRELASKAEGTKGGITNEQIHKRLSDAVTAGLVKKGTWRQCLISGRSATVWYSVGVQSKLIRG